MYDLHYKENLLLRIDSIILSVKDKVSVRDLAILYAAKRTRNYSQVAREFGLSTTRILQIVRKCNRRSGYYKEQWNKRYKQQQEQLRGEDICLVMQQDIIWAAGMVQNLERAMYDADHPTRKTSQYGTI